MNSVSAPPQISLDNLDQILSLYNLELTRCADGFVKGIQVAKNRMYQPTCGIEAFSAMFDLAVVILKGIQWAVGDLYNAGEWFFGETFSQYTDRSLYNIATVCNFYKAHERHSPAVLSFTHHQEVYGCEKRRRAELLQMAIDNQWTCEELRVVYAEDKRKGGKGTFTLFKREYHYTPSELLAKGMIDANEFNELCQQYSADAPLTMLARFIGGE